MSLFEDVTRIKMPYRAIISSVDVLIFPSQHTGLRENDLDFCICKIQIGASHFTSSTGDQIKWDFASELIGHQSSAFTKGPNPRGLDKG